MHYVIGAIIIFIVGVGKSLGALAGVLNHHERIHHDEYRRSQPWDEQPSKSKSQAN